MDDLLESAYRVKRIIAIRDGKKVAIEKRIYSTECKPGYKRDADGKCVKMSMQEMRNRSIAAQKSAAKSSTKRKRSISLKRRASLIDK